MLQGAVRALVVLARTRSEVRAHVLRVATWAVEHEADGGDGYQERDEELKAFIGGDLSGSLAKRRVFGTFQLGRCRLLGFRDSVWISLLLVVLRVTALLECLEQNCHEEVHEPQVPDHEHWTKVEHGWCQTDGKVALFRQVHDACGEQFEDSERRHPEEFEVGVRLGRQLREAKELHANNRKDEHHATHENEQVGDLRDGVYEGDNVPVHCRPLPNHAHGAHHTYHSQQPQCRCELGRKKRFPCNVLEHELANGDEDERPIQAVPFILPVAPAAEAHNLEPELTHEEHRERLRCALEPSRALDRLVVVWHR